MQRKKLVALALALALSGCASSGRTTASLEPADPLALTLPTGAMSRLELRGRDGRLEVRASGAETISVTVELGRGCGGDASSAIRHEIVGSELRVRVEPSTKDRCDERWTVDVPETFAVSARLDRADVRVFGVSGGVEVNLGNGTIRANVPGGDIRMQVDNGDIFVATATDSYRRVRVESVVGEAELSVGGGVVRHASRPGPGDWVEIDGDGRDTIDLSATVGDVSLTIR